MLYQLSMSLCVCDHSREKSPRPPNKPDYDTWRSSVEERKTNPPSFAELVVSVRAEEDKQASKEERMRSHLGVNKLSSHSVKPKATAHQMSTLVAWGRRCSD